MAAILQTPSPPQFYSVPLIAPREPLSPSPLTFPRYWVILLITFEQEVDSEWDTGRGRRRRGKAWVESKQAQAEERPL